MLTSILKHKYFRTVLSALTLMAYAAPSFAHHAMDGQMPSTFAQGLISGFAHPIIGLDHFAFLIVIALLSLMLKSPARYLVPLSFVVATLAGSAIHIAEASIPLSETLVAASLLLGGVLLLLRKDWSGLILAAMAGLFGIFHGYAYGESIVGAENTPLLAYLAGFALIQYAIMLGIVFGATKLGVQEAMLGRLQRLGGSLALIIGGFFMITSFA